MKLLYFDCFSGISGDMTISSLLNHGIDVEKFKEELKGLSLEGYELVFGTAKKNGIAANTFKVIYDDHHHHHRNMKDIEDIINKSLLNEDVKCLSLKIFRNLADAESKIHGLPPDEVHFHEVGAVDSIIDIVSTAILINMISPDRIIFSSLPVGYGFVNSEHGLIPVPAPATMELLKDIPVYDNGVKAELVTPTGAAIARTIANEFGPLPEVKISSIGYGAGVKDFEIPNVLRTVIGTVDEKK
ncbi:nickel pincer cofactor biosynthesis protein LarC [Thermoanaerobacterium thermosaccharolyticum]|uniref:nickel pincer cofactor biosynthesis protein LarC n=1 Tax=Thermoanaerobacterium thermosaccharolyticum TaxID=1517 RepID=UPI003D2E4E0B